MIQRNVGLQTDFPNHALFKRKRKIDKTKSNGTLVEKLDPTERWRNVGGTLDEIRRK